MRKLLQNFALPAGLIALALAVLLLPFPQTGRVPRALMDLCHAPLFFLLAWQLGRWFRFPASRWTRPILVWFLVSGFGLLSEVPQHWVGRHFSWQDVLTNLLGAAAGALWLESQFSKSRRLAFRLPAILLILLGLASPLLVLIDAGYQHRQMPTLASFEAPWELSRWTRQDCEIQRVRVHPTAGNWALQVELGTGQYPGLAIDEVPPNWTPYREFAFDVTLETPESLLLIVKITDEIHNWETSDRFHYAAELHRGLNRVRIPVENIRRAPKGRLMDLSRMKMLQFFAVRPSEPSRFYLDNIRLLPNHPEEDTLVRETKGSLLPASRD